MAAKISFDNGNTFFGLDEMPEIMESINTFCYWPVIESYMDSDICEIVHNELAPCTHEQFLRRYLELSKDDLVIG